MNEMETKSTKTSNIFYKAGYKYQLIEEYTTMTCIRPEERVEHPLFSIDKTGLMTIRISYAWNGANWPAVDTDTIMEPSLVHDVGCQAIVEGLLDRKHKRHVDLEFKMRCRSNRMSRVRVWYTFKAVNRFSCRDNPNPVRSAPNPDMANWAGYNSHNAS